MTTHDTDNQDIRELLPWYLNGTLGNADAERVRGYLELHPELRQEADDVGSLLRAIAEDVTVPMLTHERVERMMGRIEKEPQQTNRLNSFCIGLRRWFSRLASAPGYLPVAVAAALALVAVLIVMPQTPVDDNSYRTFSEDRPSIPLQVKVLSSLSATETQALFDEYNLRSEQRTSGVYTVTLSGDTSVNELYRILQTLRADGRVVTASALTEED